MIRMTDGPIAEYGIAYHSTPTVMHRGPMTLEEACEWLREFEEDGGRTGMFIIVERQVGAWEHRERSD